MSCVLAAVLDLDDCLVDTAATTDPYAQWFARAYGVPVEEVKAADQLHDGRRHAFFTDLKDRFGIKVPVTELYAEYRLRVPRLTPYRPEVCQMVRALLDAGWRLTVLSNGAPDTQWAKLRHSGLHRFFPRHRVVTSGEWGPRKPERELFAIALDALDVPTAVMVGDSLHDDIAGAKAAGLYTVFWLALGRQLRDGDPQPDHVVQTVTEAGDFLLTATNLVMPIPA
ncbi:HAD family hydrolase [Streptomyces sp. NPDC053048]|uniref:HAD family hydrolase n=1 Tax=Streptomyces sp. NPDC053048 TaxID=3365694 RepID=UPI0037D4EBFB